MPESGKSYVLCVGSKNPSSAEVVEHVLRNAGTAAGEQCQSLFTADGEDEELDAVAALRCGTVQSAKRVYYYLLTDEDLASARLRPQEGDCGPSHVRRRHLDLLDPAGYGPTLASRLVARRADAKRVSKAEYKARILKWRDEGLVAGETIETILKGFQPS